MNLRIFGLSILVALSGWNHVSGQATSDKSYQIPLISSEVSIHADGSVDVSEHLTYDFDGSFSWAEYQLPKQGFKEIRNIRITENGQTYTNQNNENAGTFSVAQNDEAIKIKWHYSAENEKRTFTISYTLEGALTVGTEWSQFYWNFLSEDRDKSTDRLDISINLPGTVPADSLYGWTRRPLGRMDLQKEHGQLIVTGTDIEENDFAKVRALFPTSVLSNPAITDQNFSLSQAQQLEQAYEQRMAELKEHKKYWQEVGPKVHYAIIFLAVVIFYFLYQKYGKRHSTSHLSDTETIMMPGQQSPAAVGWLLSGRYIRSVHLISTVLDLARRGYFKIQEAEPEDGWFEDDDPTFLVERTDQTLQDDLLDWEKEVIHFIEKRLDADTQKLDEIFESNDSDVSSWFNDWNNQLKEHCFDQEWIDLKSYTGAYWNAAVQVLLFFATFGFLFYLGQGYTFDFGPTFWVSWIAALVVTAIGAAFSLAIIRPTKKGEELKHQWENYKKGLKNAGEHSISTDKLDKHFIYGLALGLGEDELENLFTENTDIVPTYAWIVFAGNPSSAAAIASSFSTLGATGAASAPGTAGGAGASAGAAGGGAAASAG